MFADLHIHTCLSPCATLDMTPRKIVEQAQKRHLEIIAITDHNSAENAGSVMAAAQDTGLCVIPGIEVTTSEEAHIVGLFENPSDALSMQTLVYDHLQPGENDDDLFGMQVIANAFDEVEGMNRRLLIGATNLGLNEVIDAIHKLNGLAVAAHIDRQAFSIISQLGFIPEGLDLDAVEISRRMTLTQARTLFKMKHHDKIQRTLGMIHHQKDEIHRRQSCLVCCLQAHLKVVCPDGAETTTPREFPRHNP